jgi:small redox-active disulfide protein 2
MAFFNFGKKKETKVPASCCSSTENKVEETTSCCCGKPVEGVCCVKVLGVGCKNCRATLEAAKEAIKNIGLNIEVEYVTEMEEIMGYGVMSMPALVVNEQIVSMGKVLKTSEVEKLIRTHI